MTRSLEGRVASFITAGFVTPRQGGKSRIKMTRSREDRMASFTTAGLVTLCQRGKGRIK